MIDKFTAYRVPKKLILARNDFSTVTVHSDLGETRLGPPVRRFEGTEMAIDMATQTDEPIASRGFGGLYLCICLWLASAREGNRATFPVSSDFTSHHCPGYGLQMK
ncbi:unnamed protein product [Ixodes pacificus]